MFQKYNVEDLYLARISICYPKTSTDTNNYSYITILKKEKETYGDLKHPLRKIESVRNPKRKSFVIDYMEPLCKYYTQDGELISKKEAMLAIKNTLY